MVRTIWIVVLLAGPIILAGKVTAQEFPSPESLFKDEAPVRAEPASQADQNTKPDATKQEEQETIKTPDVDQKSDASKSDGKSKSSEKSSAKKQLRQISLGGHYVDHMEPMSFSASDLLMGGSPAKRKSFFHLLEYLDELRTDDQVTHILFDLSDPNLIINSAQLDELIRKFAAVKSSGKRMIAWLENAENAHMAIAAQCNDIVMTDFGGVDLPSASLETTFYRDAMDLIGVKASVVRAGEFKGAVEPYMNSQMSDHLREHYVKMLESVNAARVSRIAKGRGLTTAQVRDLQKKRMLLPADALSAGLVTKLAPYGSMKKTIQEMVGNEIEWTTPKAKPKREMSFFEVMGKIMGGGEEPKVRLREDSIAVLHLSGAIEDGKEISHGAIVAGPTVKAIEEIIKEDRIKGVVVRVNSPGGSATASEAIRQALVELAKKKPVVFSMGDVAASGGYWITCIGQPIYAEHGTITGSIGVFSMKLSLGPLLKRVGVHVESVAIDSSASMDAMDRTWSDEELVSFQRFIDEVYHRFLNLASESRKLPIEKLKDLASGRVWSGEQAKSVGLVDEIGGVADCVALVAKKAGIEKYKVIHRPHPASSLGLFSMFEEPDENQLRYRLLEQKLLGSLRVVGIRLDGLRVILRDAAGESRALPTIWALMPGDLRVR